MSAMAELEDEFHLLVAALEAEGHSLAAKLRDWFRRVTYKTPDAVDDVEPEAGQTDAPAAKTVQSEQTTPAKTEEPK